MLSQQASALNEKAIVIGHVPFSDGIANIVQYYHDALQKHQHVVKNVFFGHTHYDEVRLSLSLSLSLSSSHLLLFSSNCSHFSSLSSSLSSMCYASTRPRRNLSGPCSKSLPVSSKHPNNIPNIPINKHQLISFLKQSRTNLPHTHTSTPTDLFSNCNLQHASTVLHIPSKHPTK